MMVRKLKEVWKLFLLALLVISVFSDDQLNETELVDKSTSEDIFPPPGEVNIEDNQHKTLHRRDAYSDGYTSKGYKCVPVCSSSKQLELLRADKRSPGMMTVELHLTCSTGLCLSADEIFFFS